MIKRLEIQQKKLHVRILTTNKPRDKSILISFLAHTPESTVRIIWLIPNLVQIIIGIKLEKVQKF